MVFAKLRHSLRQSHVDLQEIRAYDEVVGREFDSKRQCLS